MLEWEVGMDFKNHLIKERMPCQKVNTNVEAFRGSQSGKLEYV